MLLRASSGIAAVLLSEDKLATTYHSALNFNFSKKTKKITMADYERWNKIKILIIDEISMASASDLKQISDRLQQLKGNHSIPFGGLDVIFA